MAGQPVRRKMALGEGCRYAPLVMHAALCSSLSLSVAFYIRPRRLSMLHWTTLNIDAVMAKLRREHPAITRSEVRRCLR